MVKSKLLSHHPPAYYSSTKPNAGVHNHMPHPQCSYVGNLHTGADTIWWAYVQQIKPGTRNRNAYTGCPNCSSRVNGKQVKHVCLPLYLVYLTSKWLTQDPIEISTMTISTYMIDSTKLCIVVFSCILRCCALSEITVAQVFSLRFLHFNLKAKIRILLSRFAEIPWN